MRARIATGGVLAPAAVVLTLWSPSWLFASLALALMLAALAEWSRLNPATATAPAPTAVAVAAVAAVMIAAALWLFLTPQKLPAVCLAGLLFWAYQAVDLARKGLGNAPEALSNLIQGGVIGLFAWCALVWLHAEQGALITIAVLLIVWSADSGAYFAGKRFGKRKLAPAISPGKTVAGLVGGVAGAAGVALLLAVLLPDLSAAKIPLWLLAAVVAALFSVVGDLYESRMKRRAGVKDSGSLLPGHGGILDRIDGLLAALPPFVIIWRLAE